MFLVPHFSIFLEQVLDFAQHPILRPALLQVTLEILTGRIAFIEGNSAAVHLFRVSIFGVVGSAISFQARQQLEHVCILLDGFSALGAGGRVRFAVKLLRTNFGAVDVAAHTLATALAL